MIGFFFRTLAIVLAAFGAPAGAFALGGAASGRDSGLEAHLVMVLSRDGARHGACTGTVVAPTVILTAAHCVTGKKSVAVAYSEAGSHVLQRVSARALHPGFSGRSRVSVDLALIRLETPLPPRFQPLPMDRGEVDIAIGRSKTIAGFGIAEDGVEASAGTLRSARVPILPQLYARFLRIGGTSGATLGDLAICVGDSGGPVLSRDGAGPVVVGVVYGREKLANTTHCGVIAQAVRLAPQRGWIDGVMARWGTRADAR